MEDIGCHFKFEQLNGNTFHDTRLMLSSGRNCVRYIIKERNIKKILLPYFLCETIKDVCEKEQIEIMYYHINEELEPDISSDLIEDNTYLYFVNYYGMLREKIPSIIDKYKNVIIDNTHDFYDENKYKTDTIYNYRKYFGVPDGACIVSKELDYNPKYKTGKSLGKIIEMVSRDETGEFFHYPSFLEADRYFREEELCYMSNFTSNYIRGLDYNGILIKRLTNYKTLLLNINNENLKVSNEDLSYMFPLYSQYGDKLRNYLLANNIYSQKLWPNVEWNGANQFEKDFAKKIVLLPIDQRYNIKDMNYIAEKVNEFSYKK